MITLTMAMARMIRYVPILQHGALEVTDGLAVLDELGGLAEVRVRARGVDEGADLALADNGCGEHRVARTTRGGQ
jgi:hypothetical protein